VPVLPTAVTLDAARPTVIVLDRGLIAGSGADPERLRHLAKRAALVAIGDVGEAEPGDDFPGDLLVGYLPANADPATIIAMLRGAFRSAASIVAERRALAEGEERRRELADLTRLGAALSTQRDLLTLLDMILTQARRITCSVDSCSPTGAGRRTAGTSSITMPVIRRAHSSPRPSIAVR